MEYGEILNSNYKIIRENAVWMSEPHRRFVNRYAILIVNSYQD